MTSDYSKSSCYQYIMNQHALPQLIRYLKKSSKLATSSISIGDFGCSTGRNSCLIFKSAFEKLREDIQTPIYITHEDLPHNHWNEFFSSANEVNYTALPDIFMSIAGRSFYFQVFPKDSLHLAFTAIAIHWMQTPIECKDHIVGFMSKDPETLTKAREIARNDLKTILNHRSNELISGGFFVIDTLISYKDNSTLEFLNEFTKLCADEGFLTVKEVEKMVIPLYFHSVEEWKDVLGEMTEVYMTRFMEPYEEPSPYWIDYLEHQDRNKYAEEAVGYIRAWLERSVVNALERNQDDVQEIVNWYFIKLKEYVIEKLHIVTFSTAVIVLERL